MLNILGYEMSALQLAGQVISIAAMVVTVLSFQMKKRGAILLFQVIGNVLFLLSYLCLQTWAAVAINVVYIIRNVVYMFKGRLRVLNSVAVPIVFGIACTAMGLLTWGGIRDVLAIVGALFGCVALYMTDEKKMLTIKLGDSVCWLVYNSLCMVTGGIICEVCNLASIALSLARRKQDKTVTPDPQ